MYKSACLTVVLGLAISMMAQADKATPASPFQKGAAEQAVSEKELSNIGLDLTSANKGFVVSLSMQPEIDPGAVQVNFDSISGDVARADVIRVVLQSLSKLAPHNPSIVEFATGRQERLLLDGKDIADVVFQFNHDKPLPAWRLFAEHAAKPDGSKIKLPDGVLARTTASFALVDEIIRGAEGANNSSSASTDSQEAKWRETDKWHRGASDEHGEVVSKILTSIREMPVKVKDGAYLDHYDVENVMRQLREQCFNALRDAKIAFEQQEQGAKTDPPSGFSELLGLQIKFRDIFKVTDDNLLVPVTETMLNQAPESTFAGLTVYGKHREVKTRITGKAKSWNSGVSGTSVGHSYYQEYFETDHRAMAPIGNEVMLRWGDIKDKIALDWSDKKMQEDSEMERRALAAAN